MNSFLTIIQISTACSIFNMIYLYSKDILMINESSKLLTSIHKVYIKKINIIDIQVNGKYYKMGSFIECPIKLYDTQHIVVNIRGSNGECLRISLLASGVNINVVTSNLRRAFCMKNLQEDEIKKIKLHVMELLERLGRLDGINIILPKQYTDIEDNVENGNPWDSPDNEYTDILNIFGTDDDDDDDEPITQNKWAVI
jgi:hypothetical protein